MINTYQILGQHAQFGVHMLILDPMATLVNAGASSSETEIKFEIHQFYLFFTAVKKYEPLSYFRYSAILGLCRTSWNNEISQKRKRWSHVYWMLQNIWPFWPKFEPHWSKILNENSWQHWGPSLGPLECISYVIEPFCILVTKPSSILKLEYRANAKNGVKLDVILTT